MARRPASGLSRHDREVKRIADRLSNSGYRVNAAVPGHPRPSTIGGRRPDVVATKGGAKRIIEVETEDTYDRDRGQRRAFRDYADRHENTSFHTVKI